MVTGKVNEVDIGNSLNILDYFIYAIYIVNVSAPYFPIHTDTKCK